MQAAYPWATVIANGENLGFAEGCNVGLHAARGEFLMLINPDAFATAEALAGMMEFLRAHPKAGAVGCTLLHDDGRPQMSFYPPIGALMYVGYSSIGYPVLEWIRKQLMRAGLLRYSRPLQCGWLMGSCIMVPRAAHEAVGGLEASYFMYCEDADWCERIRRAGWEVWFLPELVMHHRQKGSSRRAAEFTFRRVYRSIVHYANRNLSGWRRRALLWTMMADMLARLPVYMVYSLIRPARRERLASVMKLFRIALKADPDLYPDPRPGR
jgi:GT2 family glycosyltransferase